MRHIFVINPTSGVGDYKRYLTWIKEYFNDESKYEIYLTEYPKHASEIARKYTIRDNVCIYAVGGDGTAYEVLNGLNDGVAMALLPNGTGNDFHRAIYKNKFDDYEMLVSTIEGSIVHVDYGIVNEHRFLNMFCLGIDAMVGDEANKYSKKRFFPNSLSYVYAALKKVIKPPKINVSFEYNGEIIKQDSLLMAVMNGEYYGGGFHPAPEADIVDGYFNVLLVDHLSRRKMLPLIPKYAKGKHKQLKEVQDFKLKNFSVTLDQKVVYSCDGEVFEDDYLVVTMMEKRLPFMMPKGSVYNDSNRE